MNLNRVNLLVKLLLISLFVVSCASKKDVLLLQDIENYKVEQDSTVNHLTIKKNDLISIIVTSIDQKSSIPFNLPVVSSSFDTSMSSNLSSSQQVQSYLVDEYGFIDFPVLGRLKALGKTTQELKEELKRDLLKYMKDPIINVRIQNFSISILGEVRSPGTYTVSNERINILQAISLAGDFTEYAVRDNVLIVREMDSGKKEYLKVDFTNKNILTSPYYYLKQNDVIIVSPNGAQVQASAFNRNTGIYFSIVGLIITVANFLIN